MISLQHIRLRSITQHQTFGVDVPLVGGLNVIWADNTSGKSTLMQSVLYAFGFERSLGTSLNTPLPYAMREEIRENPHDELQKVLQSYVALTFKTQHGEIVTIRRDVVGGSDPKMVQTWFGTVDQPDDSKPRADYFLYDAGSATRERGFHSFLETCLGWKLPQVPRFDGSECPLYLETIFPMFFVEQKRGWATTQGPFPTMFRIQDLDRRVMEYILDLDVGKSRRRLAELRKERTALQLLWKERRRELLSNSSTLVRIGGIPLEPTAEFSQNGQIQVTVFFEGEWIGLDSATMRIGSQISEFESQSLQEIQDVNPQLKEDLSGEEEKYSQLTAQLQVMRRDFQLARSEKMALDKRISALEIDLTQNQDAEKLQKLGSVLGEIVEFQSCPTCHQHVDQELLPDTKTLTMGIDENIAFIKSQLDLYRSLRNNTTADLNDLRVQYKVLQDDISEARLKIRSLKSDLLRPKGSVARTELEAVLRLKTRLEKWQEQQEQLDEALDEVQEIAKDWVTVDNEIKLLGSTELSFEDKNKVGFVQTAMQALLKSFNFTSFEPTEITLSDQLFKPRVLKRDDDGELIERDIGFEVSASDGIRLKWAYYLAILLGDAKYRMMHMGFVVFDEPGQQQMKDVDLSTLLKWGSSSVKKQHQLIISTSENRERVEGALAGSDAMLHLFDGYLLRPI